MTAVLQRGYGSAEVLSVGARARPRIGPREVLVEVHAAGMDRGTWHLMAGYPYAVRLATGLTTPRNPVPGLDLAGTVVEVGAQVTRFAPGDRVFGIGKGSYAQLAAAREDKLALMPQRLSFEQAAVVPVSGLTALQALRDSGRVAAGQRVLIIGASGGVGTYAVQLARAFGAHVTAVCSGAKAEKVRSLGAERVIDHAREDWADGSAKYDLILDIAGNAPLGRLRRAATREGTIVFVGGEGGGALTGMGRQLGALLRAPFISQRVRLKLPDENGADLEVLRGLIDEGKVTPAIDSTWRLEQVPEAMRRLVAGAVTGKLCISVAR
ncbi:MAG: NAD(P)-dependent alcohol dehydrogenase [Archangiaceae bacterium]|nr:NAD(P)-dependent alcohol dehydrogenase [Archangiaceae bacterium]